MAYMSISQRKIFSCCVWDLCMLGTHIWWFKIWFRECLDHFGNVFKESGYPGSATLMLSMLAVLNLCQEAYLFDVIFHMNPVMG